MTDAGRKRRGRPEGRFYPLMGRRALRSVARASVRPDGLAVARVPRGRSCDGGRTSPGGCCARGTYLWRGATSSRLRGATVALEKDSLSKRLWLQP